MEITLPRCLSKQATYSILTTYFPSQSWKKGVIKAPCDITTGSIKYYTGAVWAHRIIKRINEEIVHFEHNLPEKVKVGLYAFKVHAYTPQPIHCNLGQRFVHKPEDCRQNSTICLKCSGQYSISECTSTSDSLKCTNCNGPHGAAYRGCPKFMTVQQALSCYVREGVSFCDAIKSVTIQSKENSRNDKPAKS